MRSTYYLVIFRHNAHFKPKALGLSFMQCRSLASLIDLKLYSIAMQKLIVQFT